MYSEKGSLKITEWYQWIILTNPDSHLLRLFQSTLVDGALDLKQEPILWVILFYPKVDEMRERMEDHLLQSGLHHMSEIVTWLHARVDQSTLIVVQKKIVHLSDEATNLQNKETINKL